MYIILDSMVRLLAPILAFTSNEIWLSMPHDASANAAHIMLNDMPKKDEKWVFTAEEEEAWSLSQAVRSDVNKALELARAEKTVGKPLDANITLYVDDNGKAVLDKIKDQDLKTLFIVSDVKIVEGEGEGYEGEVQGVKVKVEANTAPKCVRCWTHDEHIGEDPDHPELCPRCAKVVRFI